jgi:hypothetical protein
MCINSRIVAHNLSQARLCLSSSWDRRHPCRPFVRLKVSKGRLEAGGPRKVE